MSVSQWIALMICLPLGLVGVWIQVWRIWRRGADVSAATEWMHGAEGKVGYHAFLLPAALSLTLGWMGVLLVVIDGDHPGSPLDRTADVLMIVAICGMCFAFWMWAFAWPRLLVPHQFRGQPGWVQASWINWREHRRDAKARRGEEDPQRPPGRHSRGD